MSTSNRGKYYRPMPVDRLILATMPEVGTIGGVHWRGRQVRDIVTELIDDEIDVTNTLVTARLKSMEAAGHVRIFPTSGKAAPRIWAKTESGIALEKEEEDYGA